MSFRKQNWRIKVNSMFNKGENPQKCKNPNKITSFRA